MSEEEITTKYKFVSIKQIHEVFVMLKGLKKYEKEIDTIQKIMMFISEYNTPRTFSHQPMMRNQKGQMVKDGGMKHFWAEHRDKVYRKPWQPKLTGLKFHEDHWLADREQVLKMAGIKK